MKVRRITAFAIISLIWGSGWLVQQLLPALEDQLRFSALVYGLCAVLLGGIGALLRLPLPGIKESGYSAALGVTLVALPYLLTFWAAPRVSSGLAIVIFSITPLVTTFFLDAPWPARNSAIAGVSGIVLVAADTVSASGAQIGGALALLIGVAATAGSLVFAGKYLLKSHPVFTASIQLAVAAAILKLASIAGPWRAVSAPGNFPWMLIVCACAANSIAYALYYWLLQRIRPDQLASIVWLQFLVFVAEGAFLLRPHIQLRMLTGVAVVIAALVAMARSESKNKLLTLGVTLRPR
jgi:drug/metabolite transporter (DMT)-like permease